MKVPLPVLQMSRMEYTELSSTTFQIIDQFCQKAFELDETKEYFIKTGVFSSKFDFRNAYIHDAKEVKEIGEYLLFISFQASCLHTMIFLEETSQVYMVQQQQMSGSLENSLRIKKTIHVSTKDYHYIQNIVYLLMQIQRSVRDQSILGSDVMKSDLEKKRMQIIQIWCMTM